MRGGRTQVTAGWVAVLFLVTATTSIIVPSMRIETCENESKYVYRHFSKTSGSHVSQLRTENLAVGHSKQGRQCMGSRRYIWYEHVNYFNLPSPTHPRTDEPLEDEIGRKFLPAEPVRLTIHKPYQKTSMIPERMDSLPILTI